MSHKSILRQQLIKDRLQLSPRRWSLHSKHLCERLAGFAPFREGTAIASFFSYKQEPDLLELVDDRPWFFPHCAPNKTLHWYPWRRGEPLLRGKYGIVEPLPPSGAMDPPVIDVILVPAVACDRGKYRLGYGGGYYDRFLSSIKTPKPIAIAIVFDQFCVPHLPHDPWDQALDYVCTESTIF